jgi:hypothetical protein
MNMSIGQSGGRGNGSPNREGFGRFDFTTRKGKGALAGADLKIYPVRVEARKVFLDPISRGGPVPAPILVSAQRTKATVLDRIPPTDVS